MWGNKLRLNPEKAEVLCILGSYIREVGRQPVLNGVAGPQLRSVLEFNTVTGDKILELVWWVIGSQSQE